ncbi:feline leukemia virus subgroup C receptor-related protein 2-like isoform X1 [Daphnia pulex]|uniref:feline leukemia virus subgroup C receptor-related protein 2-like isoform X1 n=1 Tax=Daphnia pulex TaxID=6669 RepID=UPI001EE0C8B5|nr:feline leukemia virus subgroup C receptor-related protein 2-like isoform X1 [Daphnia pulex]XP_046438071.1 feline leukemia virus subgroup C receptor-related protein 2-like isoform X1 [Daphnia pulex]XP_046438072.1 feline leukemia virus subgroup C receptor-related protein 2-like isoform X1 [Daphnia pulex]XP_046438073.1 feline leukemia virus subgroup C receptor-related protein 2-like isoform X1 [Daphnia pulex]
MTSYQVVPTVESLSAAPQRTPSKTEVGDETQKLNAAGAREELCFSPLPIQTKVYRRRWLMLVIFLLVSMSSAFQWIQFAIINNLIMKYYNVDSTTVDWTSLVYMVTYIPLIFPGAWIMDKVGLRITLLMGAFGTALGAWIKVLGVAPDLFYVALIGQTITAMSQVFILGVPPNVAAVWFGAEQVSSACSIGVFGNQLGVALGFFLPPILVKDHENIDDIGADLKLMFYIVAGVCTALFIVVVIGFQAKPPLPPNAARIAPQSSQPVTYYQSVKTIVTNKNYILLLITYGINAGVFYAMSTLLNQTVLRHFPGEEENAGRIGLTIVVCGMFGSVVCGIILDKTHKFRETTLVVYGLAVAGMVAYTFTFELQYIVITFVTAGAVGFFMTGYLPVGFEFAAELTYPEPEVTSSGLLNASAQVFGIVFTIIGGWLLSNYGDLVCNGSLSAALFFGAALSLFIRSDLRRQRANQMEAFRANEAI